jgi:hypothetical protein
MEMRGRAFVDK